MSLTDSDVLKRLHAFYDLELNPHYKQLFLDSIEEIERWRAAHVRCVVALVKAGVPSFGRLEEGIERLAQRATSTSTGVIP